jgi:c-di-GMP-binding flagellar brake protein YcgR
MPDRGNLINAHGSIADALKVLHQGRFPLAVSIPQSDETFTSYVIRVGKQLHLDQLMPAHGDQLLQAKSSVTVRTNHAGQLYWFNTRYLSRGADARGLPYHVLEMPARLEHEDKRASFRIPLRLADNPRCVIALSAQERHQARLKNISEGGVCIRLPGRPDTLDTGKVVDCSVLLGEEEILQIEARVQHQQAIPRTSDTRVGLSFRRLPTREANALHRTLMQLQRRNIRSSVSA